MSFTSIKLFYWIFFGVSITILLMNAGLLLVVSAIIVVPLLILHLMVGLRLSRIKNYKESIVLSSLCLLLFALAKPDGAHGLNETGFSKVLEIVGIYTRLDEKHENIFILAALFFLITMGVYDIRLLRKKKSTENSKRI